MVGKGCLKKRLTIFLRGLNLTERSVNNGVMKINVMRKASIRPQQVDKPHAGNRSIWKGVRVRMRRVTGAEKGLRLYDK